ncbi:MAG: hypothetical protein WAT39_13560 [Planctomycetota bacterium]
MTSRLRSGMVCCIALIATTACSSGDGTLDSGAASVRVTTANSRTAASTAFFGAGGVVDVAGTGSLAYRASESFTAPERFDLRGFLERQIDHLAARTVLAARTTEVIPCGAGTITAVFDDNDENEAVSTGDRFELSFDSCDDGGFVVNGSLVIDRIIVDGNLEGSTFTFLARLGFDNLSLTRNGGTARINGLVGIAENSTETRFDETFDVLADLSAGAATLAAGSSLALTATATAVTTSQGGRIAADAFGNPDPATTARAARVTYATATSFTRAIADAFPSSGVLLVNGAGGSRLRLTALNSTDVTIEVDQDGDGAFESSETLTWVALAAVSAGG